MATRITEDVQISGNLTVTGAMSSSQASITNAMLSPNAAIVRSKLAQENLAVYPVALAALRVWDDLTSPLPGTAANDDLAIIEGTFGTHAPVVQSSDAKGTTVTQRARVQIPLPVEYVAGQTVQVVVRAAMNTTVSDGTATLDLEAYKPDGDGAVGSDLCTTAAQSINSLTHADLAFTITPGGLEAGDELDLRLTVAITDALTATAVIAEITAVSLQCDIKG